VTRGNALIQAQQIEIEQTVDRPAMQ